MQPASQRLRSTISLVRGTLTSRIRKVWSHPRIAELYPEFLFAMYPITAASAPSMRAAAACCESLADDDPLKEWLRDYYLEHAEEEQGHGEWILNDLASLGIVRDQALARLPYPGVASLVGSQYFWMHHVHPIAYLGYIAVLEQPTDPSFLHEFSVETGIPLTSMSAHVLHATLDPHHVAEFDATFDRLPLTERQREIITISAIATVKHLEALFADLLEHFDRIDNPLWFQSIFTAPRSSAQLSST
ncbi:MAG: iron-containing redox enzyme family protein [Acidobacteriaceae bacterium]